MRALRVVGLWVLGAFVLLAVLAGGVLWQTHVDTGVVTGRPAAPTSLRLDDRTYDRSLLPGSTARVPANARRVGTTGGGGEIWAEQPLSQAPRQVWVVAQGTTYVYATTDVSGDGG